MISRATADNIIAPRCVFVGGGEGELHCLIIILVQCAIFLSIRACEKSCTCTAWWQLLINLLFCLMTAFVC